MSSSVGAGAVAINSVGADAVAIERRSAAGGRGAFDFGAASLAAVSLALDCKRRFAGVLIPSRKRSGIATTAAQTVHFCRNAVRLQLSRSTTANDSPTRKAQLDRRWCDSTCDESTKLSIIAGKIRERSTPSLKT